MSVFLVPLLPGNDSLAETFPSSPCPSQIASVPGALTFIGSDTQKAARKCLSTNEPITCVWTPDKTTFVHSKCCVVSGCWKQIGHMDQSLSGCRPE